MSAGNRRILVVDHDPDSCESVAYFLKSLGYSVAIAADGTRALNLTLVDNVELVILDDHIPLYGNPSVVATLRGRRLSRSVKFLALTQEESPAVRDALSDWGADAYLSKPVDLDSLREEVGRLIPGQAQSEGPLHRRVRERAVGTRRSSSPPLDPRVYLVREGG
jgi:DNA-binding response OmpR family regulator